MKKIVLVSAAAAALVAAPAMAADLPVKAPAYRSPVVVPYNWTGCFIGGNVGYGWGRNQVNDFITAPGFDVGSNTGTGVVGGGQIGCDYQTATWVFGVQGMFDGSGVKGSLRPNGAGLPTNSPNNPVGFTANEILEFKTEWLATLTGRIGYLVQPQALVYVKGGAAWAHNSFSDGDLNLALPYFGEVSATRSGWTIGGGFEYSFLRNWSLFVEYNFIDLGSRHIMVNYVTNNPGIANPYGYDVKQNLQTILFGVNYRFGWN